ncbi:hypothetical protein IW261DRAFT_966796 [Armillaria novae-zelandiae]|uniref:Uncharacterized protein n=1 Tax=Armillaria novae-zelandiae TaxID=153914 RepID=A0AA39TEA9_9AGAR|nr:hypothetical protein IW261DRAFT_966796 [Armillaria novae-zelandiae]
MLSFFASPTVLRGTDNIRQYTAKCLLPEMPYVADAPQVPLPGHKTHMNRLHIRPEPYRRLEMIDCETFMNIGSVITQWARCAFPDKPLKVNDLDEETGENLTLPCPAAYNFAIADIWHTAAVDIHRFAGWLDTFPLTTTQRLLHLAFPNQTKAWHFKLKQDRDKELFQYFLWTSPQLEASKTRPPLDPDALEMMTRKSVVIAFQPPWIMSPADLKEFVECQHFPPYQGSATNYLESKHRVWGKLWDVCVTNESQFFVLTTYDQWVFGTFSQRWKGVFFSPIYDFDSSDPSIAECLTFWIASAMRITKILVLPKIPEPVGLPPIVVEPSDDPIEYHQSESNWTGKSSDYAASAGVVLDNVSLVSDAGVFETTSPINKPEPTAVSSNIHNWMANLPEVMSEVPNYLTQHQTEAISFQHISNDSQPGIFYY